MIINKLFKNNNHSRNQNLSLVNARNVIFDDNFLKLRNEDGFEKIHTFDNDICGVIPTDKELIVFTTDNAGDDGVHRVNGLNITSSLKGNLNLSTESPVKGEFQYNNRGDLIVCFNDAKRNPIRLFNFDNPYMEINETTKEMVNPADGLNKLRLFPHYSMPELDISEAKEGRLPKGTYHVIVSYYIGDFDRLNWSLPSAGIYIGKTRPVNMVYYAGETKDGESNTSSFGFTDAYQYESEDVTDKMIQLIIEGIDTSFSKYKLAVIHRTDTSSKVYDLGDFSTTVNSHNIAGLTNNELSLDEVTIPYIAYDKAEDITISNDRLTIVGPGTSGTIDYQKYANNIKVKYVTKDLNDIYFDQSADRYEYPSTFEDGLTATLFFYAINKTLILDEVYGLYIGIIGKDGTNKGFFHIPGREPKEVDGGLESRQLTTDEKNSYNVDDTDSTRTRNESITSAAIVDYYYQLYNTAANYDASDKYLGYWENSGETYPSISSFEVWDVDVDGVGYKIGDLGGENVRHHKIPDISKLYDDTHIDTAPSKVVRIVLEDVKFPEELLEDVQGFVLAYANRNSGNSTVLGYHPMIPNTFWSELGGDYYGPRRSVSTNVIKEPVSRDDVYREVTTASVRFNDFGLLTNKPAISNPYLKTNYVSNPAVVDKPIIDTTTIKSYKEYIYGVRDYRYLPKDNSATDPSNRGREESLILVLNALPQSIPTGEEGYEVCTLKSHLNNVYYPFYEQKLSIAEHITKVQSGTYSYLMTTAYDFDGYLSYYYSIMFRGDQTIELDDSGDRLVPTRTDGDADNDAVTVVNAFKCLNISTVNTEMKSMKITKDEAEYQEDKSKLENTLASLTDLIFGDPIIGSYDYIYEYDSNFIVDPSKDNNISYNKMYSFVNSLGGHYSHNHNNVLVVSHPHRVARSAIQSKEAITVNWRYFSALEYYEMPKHRGTGNVISGLDNMLLIHFEHSLFVAKSKDKISIPDGDDAYIGTADIFSRRPEELLPTAYGTAGIQSRFGYALSDFGYTFVDTYESNIYNYSNEGVSILTNEANREFFKKYLNTSDGKPLTSKDVIIGVDHLHKRLIVTNLGNNEFTISFCYHPNAIGFISLHDYVPSIMVNNRNGAYSVNSKNLKELYQFNAGELGTYYNGTKYESYIDVLINENPQTNKILYSLSMQSGVDDDDNHIDKLFVYNKNKCSKVYSLTKVAAYDEFDGLRFLDDAWNYDMIRDYSSDDIVQVIVDDFGNIIESSIKEDKQWFELGDIHGRFFVIRLITNNDANMRFNNLEYNVDISRR